MTAKELFVLGETWESLFQKKESGALFFVFPKKQTCSICQTACSVAWAKDGKFPFYICLLHNEERIRISRSDIFVYGSSLSNSLPGSLSNSFPGSLSNSLPGSLSNSLPGSLSNSSSLIGSHNIFDPICDKRALIEGIPHGLTKETILERLIINFHKYSISSFIVNPFNTSLFAFEIDKTGSKKDITKDSFGPVRSSTKTEEIVVTKGSVDFNFDVLFSIQNGFENKTVTRKKKINFRGLKIMGFPTFFVSPGIQLCFRMIKI